ncbi:MAG: DUF2721 domain-containing protein [Phycisphaerae bacterium]
MLHEALQPLLAPVVLISACGLMIMALNVRTMSSQSRIRQLHHERLEIAQLAEASNGLTPTQRLRYEGVGNQSNNLLRRLHLMRRSLMCMVGCVVLMLTCSLSIGITGLAEDSPFDELAILAFVSGVLSMLTGAVTFLAELRISLDEIAYEHHRMVSLPSLEESASPLAFR